MNSDITLLTLGLMRPTFLSLRVNQGSLPFPDAHRIRRPIASPSEADVMSRPRSPRRLDPGVRRRLYRLQVEAMEDRRLLATIAVAGTSDTVAVDGVVTLREAIISANGNADVNADVT